MTFDELYVCLTGDAPIEVLAQAKSKGDGRYHPQAFVHQYGKGRVFLTTLGHDVKAWTNSPSVGELLRRGTAWSGKLAPVAKP
jgi:type 1 glutamine amidotransferase